MDYINEGLNIKIYNIEKTFGTDYNIELEGDDDCLSLWNEETNISIYPNTTIECFGKSIYVYGKSQIDINYDPIIKTIYLYDRVRAFINQKSVTVNAYDESSVYSLANNSVANMNNNSYVNYDGTRNVTYNLYDNSKIMVPQGYRNRYYNDVVVNKYSNRVQLVTW